MDGTTTLEAPTTSAMTVQVEKQECVITVRLSKARHATLKSEVEQLIRSGKRDINFSLNKLCLEKLAVPAPTENDRVLPADEA